MTQKRFSIIRIMTAMFVAAAISYSVTTDNYYLPIMVILIAMPFLYLMKKQVKDVLADERDYQIAGEASRYTITVFAVLATLAFFALYAARETNPYFEAVASTLSYSACFILILNGLIFKFLSKPITAKEKIIYGIITLGLALVLVVAGLRLFSGEDNWICQDGQWVRHGQPDFPAPSVECKK